MARRRWWALSAWTVLLVLAALLYPDLLRFVSASDYSVTGSDSARVADLIESDFKAGTASGGTTGARLQRRPGRPPRRRWPGPRS